VVAIYSYSWIRMVQKSATPWLSIEPVCHCLCLIRLSEVHVNCPLSLCVCVMSSMDHAVQLTTITTKKNAHFSSLQIMTHSHSFVPFANDN